MWLALFVAIIPQDGMLIDDVDTIELNRVFGDWNEKGVPRETLKQFIAWEWNYKEGRHQVVWWKLVKPHERVEADSTGWRLRFNDCGKLREIRARAYKETFTMHDREIEDRNILPVDERRQLTKAKP